MTLHIINALNDLKNLYIEHEKEAQAKYNSYNETIFRAKKHAITEAIQMITKLKDGANRD